MKITLIELNFHFDSLDSLCQLFDRDENEIYVFTTKQLYSRINKLRNDSKVSVFLQKGSRIKFIQKHLHVINNSDVIFINTISRDFRLFAKIDFGPLTIARVHNLHKTFKPLSNFALPKTPLRIWKTCSFIIREGIFGNFFFARKKALKNIDFFSFPDYSLQKYALEQKYISNKEVGPVLPIKFYMPDGLLTNRRASSEFNITIIGTIDFKRRDYHTVVNALKMLTVEENRNIVVTFLGNGNTNNGVNLKEKIAESKFLQNFEFKFYSGYVSLAEFKEVISRTDLLVSPIKMNTVVDVFHETYGLSKTSGSISDMIMYAKPMAIYNLKNGLNDLSEFVYLYSNKEDLATIFSELIQNSNTLIEKNDRLRKFLSSEYDKNIIYSNFIMFVNQNRKLNK